MNNDNKQQQATTTTNNNNQQQQQQQQQQQHVLIIIMEHHMLYPPLIFGCSKMIIFAVVGNEKYTVVEDYILYRYMKIISLKGKLALVAS